jgi:hypothetical protein
MGWALVNNANRHADCSKAPEPGLLGGVLPVAHYAVAMLTGYISATQRVIGCANHDVAYMPRWAGRPLLRALRSSPGFALA